jgi:BASS family bile acid:Na+ symporter
MTVVNSLITIFSIPFITGLALAYFMDQEASIQMPFLGSVFNIFKLTVLPATTGILVRHFRKPLAEKLEEPLRYILPLLLLLVYSGVLFLERGEGQVTLRDFFRILPYTLSLNVLAMLSGFYIPWILGIGKLNRVTISIEVGLQNSTLAIFVAASLLQDNTIAMAAVVYGSFSFFTTWAFGYLARKHL